MRRRHKAQYAAHERAHLAPSMPHVRRDRCLPGAQPNPHLHLRRTQNVHLKDQEMKTMTSSDLQVCDPSGVGSHLIFALRSLDCESHRTTSFTANILAEMHGFLESSCLQRPDSGQS